MDKKIRVPHVKEVKITGGFIKADQFLKYIGVAETGGAAKDIINSGKVRVNGETVNERGKKLRDGNIIRIYDKVFRIKNDG